MVNSEVLATIISKFGLVVLLEELLISELRWFIVAIITFKLNFVKSVIIS
jgi:hypothetical protein